MPGGGADVVVMVGILDNVFGTVLVVGAGNPIVVVVVDGIEIVGALDVLVTSENGVEVIG